MSTAGVSIPIVEMHTAGQVVRVLLEADIDWTAADQAQREADFRENHDHIRTALMLEPRGHSQMLGAIVTPPARPGSAFGLIFTTPGGYLPMCGDAVIAATMAMWHQGQISMSEGEPIVVDTPSGHVECRVQSDGHQPTRVGVLMPTAYVVARDVTVLHPGGRALLADIADGGNRYALVDARALDLNLTWDATERLRELEREIVAGLAHSPNGPVLGVAFYAPLGPLRYRFAAVYEDGVLDRSPCGTATVARLAALAARGEVSVGDEIIHESLAGMAFHARYVRAATGAMGTGIVAELTGESYQIGHYEAFIDSRDPLRYGISPK